MPKQKRNAQQRVQRQPQLLSNLQSFLSHTTPLVPALAEHVPNCGGPTPSLSFGLSDVWQCYDEWSAYGVEVPMTLCVEGVWQQVLQTYVPYLSGVQLFGADHTRRIQPSAASPAEALPAGANATPPSPSDAAELSPRPAASEATSGPSSRTVSTASTDSDSEGEDCCDSAPHRNQNQSAPDRRRNAAAPSATTAASGTQQQQRQSSSKSRGSVLRGQLGDPAKGTLLFEFTETDPPHCRLPMTDRIAELAEDCPALTTLTTADLHPASWYAVAWYPLYRFGPCVADPATSRDLQASFLTFHSLAVPPPAAPAPGAPTTAANGAPIAPQLMPPAAAALAYRGELLRQALLSQAMLSVLPQQPTLSAAAAGAVGAADQANAETNTNIAEPTKALSSMPLAVAALQPFGFVPYKAVGRTWVDEFSLHQLHLPMIAAARAWTERRGINLPDLEFFSRHQQNARDTWLPRC